MNVVLAIKFNILQTSGTYNALLELPLFFSEPFKLLSFALVQIRPVFLSLNPLFVYVIQFLTCCGLNQYSTVVLQLPL